ncbi:hypothetical protein C1645_834150 [Glomus cerebriforme]|uniref:C2H2-type domain-containing protein n=1 Tax=Glomus cerebriforme TaxID=658196 RepID=A0A397SCH4_9GLOM|nr:hypothetical protein C1645_834150 [Glomus cerebriforme]
MSYKCFICERTFSQRTSYSQHIQKYIKTAKINNDDAIHSSEMDIESNQSSDYDNNNIKIENKNEIQDISFDSIKTEMSTMSLKDEDILESFKEHEIFEEFEKLESETCTEFPNDAYKDLMILVTNYKLNNRVGNDIIRFFNKHSNLTVLPLLKNIEKE